MIKPHIFHFSYHNDCNHMGLSLVCVWKKNIFQQMMTPIFVVKTGPFFSRWYLKHHHTSYLLWNIWHQWGGWYILGKTMQQIFHTGMDSKSMDTMKKACPRLIRLIFRGELYWYCSIFLTALEIYYHHFNFFELCQIFANVEVGIILHQCFESNTFSKPLRKHL